MCMCHLICQLERKNPTETAPSPFPCICCCSGKSNAQDMPTGTFGGKHLFSNASIYSYIHTYIHTYTRCVVTVQKHEPCVCYAKNMRKSHVMLLCFRNSDGWADRKVCIICDRPLLVVVVPDDVCNHDIIIIIFGHGLLFH